MPMVLLMRGAHASRLLASPAVPFLAINGLAFATSGLRTEDTNWILVVAAELVALWVAGAAWVIPWRRLAPAWALTLPVACDAIIMLLRHAQGGATSGYGTLTLLPVVWVGLTLRRREVLAITACTAAVFALPIALIGAPDYPSTGWRGALLTTLVALVIGFVVNRVITEQRRQAKLAGDRFRTVNRVVKTQVRIATTAHDLDAVLDAVVSEARALARAEAAVVEMPDRNEMVYRAVAGTAERYAGFRLPLAGSISGACLRSMDVLVVEDSETDPRVDRDASRKVGARSMAVVPLIHDGRAAGVLKIYSSQPKSISRDDAQALSLLANVVGTALVRAELMEQLASQATTDSLTGLPNRRAWETALGLAVARARRSGDALTLILLDVDGLKAINDREGHAAGDAMLRSVAVSWATATRAGEMLARIGGDEFALLLEGADAAAGAGAVERLAAAMPRGRTASAGIAQWNGDEDMRRLLARADANMYSNKRARAEVLA